jgi:hypothetical protein
MDRDKLALSVSALAKRWGCGVERIHAMVRSGLIPGAFQVPSCGRYGKTIRIPIDAILRVEAKWTIAAQTFETEVKNRTVRKVPAPTHFPELMTELDVECPSTDQD